MIKKALIIITIAIGMVQGIQAQVQATVRDEASLNDAIASVEGETLSIRLGANITLSAYLKIGENKNQAVVIDLNGHQLRRNLDEVDANGHVIEVFDKGELTVKDSWVGGEISGGRANNGGGICNYGTLHLEGGTITNCYAAVSGGGVRNNGVMTMGGGTILGCWGKDCGGIYNAAGATLAITGGTISGNTSGAGGGGVVNYGTANISGGTIHNNHATTRGGGIWNGGTMAISGATIIGNRADIEGGGVWQGGSLTMEGAVKITDNENANVPDNFFLVQDKVINLVGAFTDDASIGIGMEKPGVFTSGYLTHNPNTGQFFPDAICDLTVNADGEACLSLNKRKYYKCSWDEANKRVVHTVQEIPDINVENICSPKYANGGELLGDNCWFIADGIATINGSLNCKGQDIHLILCDGAFVILNGLLIDSDTFFHIYCQSYGDRMGILYSNSDDLDDNPGIGNPRGKFRCGPLTIHGGNIFAKGGSNAAGIGGPYLGGGIIITFYDGKLTAYGGENGAGIGGGYYLSGGELTIYGGEVYAHGGKAAAGIGSGNVESQKDRHGGTLNIHGGIVKAWGGDYGAGIGGGENSNGSKLTISGGNVYAQGGSDAAGIGSGELDNGIYGSLTTNGGEITITDGKVEAHGGDYGAGIGGGQDSSGGTITISGGEVLAFGGTDAAGIGSGEEKSEDIDGGTITITEGYVMAEGKDAGAGLGAGEDAAMGNISISGGTVHAYGGVDSKAIYSNDMEYGANSLAISDNMMVSVGEFSGFTTKVITKEYFDIRGVETQNHRCASIEPCTHSDNGYTITDAIQHKINSCKYCLMGGLSEPHAFIDDYKCACGLLGLKDDADNTSALAKWDNTTQTVALIGNTFQKDGTWSTICLPFNIDNLTGTPLEGASVMTLDKASFNSETLTLDFTDAVGGDLPTIEVGKPYVIKWDNDTEHPSIESPLFRNVTVGNTPPDDNAITTNLVTFKGLYAPMDIAENDHHNILYLGADNTLLYPEGATRINAFQAFFIANTNIGDVNGDNMVNITDVTSLVSLILSGNADSEVKKKADVTGDGMVNVTDVTTLVSYILSGKVDIVNVVVNGAEGITFK